MSKHFFVMSGKPPCPECGDPEGVILDVGATGYSVTSGFQHLPECPKLRCPHGVFWQEDCYHCQLEADE